MISSNSTLVFLAMFLQSFLVISLNSFLHTHIQTYMIEQNKNCNLQHRKTSEN